MGAFKKYQLARKIRVNIHLFLRKLGVPSTYFLDILAVLVGYFTALGAFVFIEGIEYLEHHSRTFFHSLENPWIFPLVPAAGGLACGLIVYFFAREAKGHGIPEVIYAVLMKGGLIRARVALAKLSATVCSLGTLASAGQEGPIVQIGSAVGSSLGQSLRLKPDSIKILIGCGAAAGIAATFNAPIGGVIFALEVILGTFSPNVFTPIVIASVISAVTFHEIRGSDMTFFLNVQYSETIMETLGFALVGILCGVIAVIFIRALERTEKVFASFRMPAYFKPALGGLLVGTIIVFYQEVGGNSYQLVEDLVSERSFGLYLLLLLLVLKILATSLTLGSGGSGGIFAPSLVMGALVGATVHFSLSQAFEVSSVGIYVMVGMAAFVSGTTHGPIAAILVLCEMTGHYYFILPLMAGCIMATIVSRSLLDLSIYTIKLYERGIILKNGHDVDVLKTYHVCDLMETETDEVLLNTPLYEVLPIIHDSVHGFVLVRDASEDVVGVISYFELTPFILKDSLDHLAEEAMHTTEDFILEEDPILVAYDKFLMKETSYLIVRDKRGNFAGIVFKKDIKRSYQKALHQKSLAMIH
jgi:CIC family chloride channel protein